MARPRKPKAEPVVQGDPTIEIPEGHEEQPDSWKNAFRHAMGMKWTSEKGAILFADAHMHDPEYGADRNDPETIRAQIAALQDRLAASGG